MILTDFSLANASDIKLVIRPKMSVFVKFVRNQRIRGKFYILYY